MRRFLPILLIGILAACDAGLDGIPNENQPPSTSFTVNSINLPEGERLVSQISISWWGDDPDGYVVGFEFYIGDDVDSPSVEWSYTTRTDSVFVLPIPEGSNDADVRFTVRAVDNEGARDPNPPSLVFPIRNSPPTISFNNLELPPDTTYRVFSFGYNLSDPDGEQNLNRVEFAINDTTSAGSWNVIDPEIRLLTFRTDDTQAIPETRVFTGRTARNTDIVLNAILLDQENTFYIRAFDNAGAVSEVLEYTWYVKQQQSRILFLHDYFGNDGTPTFNLHANLLAQVGITNFDKINITDGQATGGQRVPLTSAFPSRVLSAPTTNMMLAEWDYIYWISDNLDRNIGYALEITVDFFANGGRMFINIPTKVLADDNPVLEFLPFERVQSSPAGRTFYIRQNSLMTASDAVSDPPYLRFRRNLTDSFPVVPFGETVRLFDGPYETRGGFPPQITPYDGPKVISAVNPDESILFFGIDLNEFDRETRTVGSETLPASDLVSLIRFLIIDILNFEQ